MGLEEPIHGRGAEKDLPKLNEKIKISDGHVIYDAMVRRIRSDGTFALFIIQENGQVGELDMHPRQLLEAMSKVEEVQKKLNAVPRQMQKDFHGQAVAQIGEVLAVNESSFEQLINKPCNLSDMPAIGILRSQMAKRVDHIRKENPRISDTDLSIKLTLEFFNRSYYQRISEQLMMGPEDYERTEDLDLLTKNISPLRRQIESDLKSIKAGSQDSIHAENGWLFLTRHGKKRSTDYRIYLSPEAGMMGRVFADLAETIPQDIPFQMKTIDDLTPNGLARVDKVIMYISDQDIERVWPVIQQLHGRNKQAFTNRPNPGGGKFSGLEGVSIAREEKKTPGVFHRTATQVIADQIDKTVKEKTTAMAHNLLYREVMVRRSPTDPLSPNLQFFKKICLERTSPKNSNLFYYFPSLGEINDTQKTRFNKLVGESIFEEYLSSLKTGNFSKQAVKNRFAQKIAATGFSKEEQSRIQTDLTDPRNGIQNNLVTYAQLFLNDAGLAFTFLHAGKNGRNMPDEFAEIFRNVAFQE